MGINTYRLMAGLLAISLASCSTAAHTGNAARWQQIDPIIQDIARQYRIDPLLIHAVVRIESNYSIYAVSHKGAQGLMQLMPATARELGVRNVYSPRQNIDGGVRYLVQQLRRFGSVKRALYAYHAGPNAVARGRIPRSSRRYADLVLARYYRLKGCTDFNAACLQQAAVMDRSASR